MAIQAGSSSFLPMHLPKNRLQSDVIVCALRKHVPGPKKFRPKGKRARLGSREGAIPIASFCPYGRGPSRLAAASASEWTEALRVRRGGRAAPAFARRPAPFGGSDLAFRPQHAYRLAHRRDGVLEL